MNRSCSISPCRRLAVAVCVVRSSGEASGCRPATRRLQVAGTAFVVLALLVAGAADASACAACFGKNDGKLAQGMNAGIFTLLGIICGVLFAIAGFFVFIIRRAATHPLPMPSETLSPVATSNA